ncbi:MAG: extracellular solute-binding protein [Chloroflexi bacterium]|jgi:ABC-type glycerol-3-phosphate transport system substrate-binding protein|nr:extracellular solute-binding protein [Chloroflexota bacterium]
MNKNRFFILVVFALLGALLLAACQPQTVEVTRVVEVEGETVTETVVEEVEVTRVVEGEVVTETITEEVEVTRVVETEVIVDPTECNLEGPAEETEINMMGWSFPITDFYAEELEKCSDIDNLTVIANLLSSPDANEQIRLALSSGGDSPFDIVHGANNQVAAWGGPGWLMPLNDLIDVYWDEYNLGDIPEKAWEGVTIDGNIYGVPIVSNTAHLIYRQDVFDELGLEVPETFDEVIEVCNAIGLDNPDWDMPFSFNLSAGWSWEIEFFQVLGAFGGKYLDENNMPTFNDEHGVDAVNKMVEVADACMGIDGYSFSLDDQEVAMQLGTLPSTFLFASRAANMSDPERTDLGDVIAYAPAPQAVEGGPYAGMAWNDFYMIPANTTNDPDLIFRIIMEAADERSQREAAELGMTTRLSAAEYGGPYLPAAFETISGGVGIYDKNQAVGIAIAKLGEFLPLVGSGDMTAQEALDAAAEAYIEEATAQGFIDG